MSVDSTNEKRFESDIEEFFLSAEGGYSKCEDEYDPQLGVYKDTLIQFIKDTQPKEWKRFTNMNAVDPERKFCVAFNNACDMDGVLDVLRHGFKHRGIKFRVCYFKPESSLNRTAVENYKKNVFHCIRQWRYSADNKNSVDMVLAVNGIPVFAFELKNQFKGQSVENAKYQWMKDRDPREICFQFNKRILAYFCVDLSEVWMTTKLAGDKTFFLPFNQGSNGAGNDGGKGNPSNPDGYPTDYLWKDVFNADSMMDIVQKFISLQDNKLIFPRFHQLDVVRKIVADVKQNGAGHNYLIQHSAGSGKSNSIAWTAYRLASLHDDNNKAIFRSVIVVTDRTVLDAQLQATIQTVHSALAALPLYQEATSILPGWTFNLLITQFSLMKEFNGLFLLPILSAVSQFAMTKMTPTQPQAENSQSASTGKFMTYFFPLFSLWICSSYNGAFALYWVTSNLIAMVQTYFINKILDKRAANKKAIESDVSIR